MTCPDCDACPECGGQGGPDAQTRANPDGCYVLICENCGLSWFDWSHPENVRRMIQGGVIRFEEIPGSEPAP